MTYLPDTRHTGATGVRTAESIALGSAPSSPAGRPRLGQADVIRAAATVLVVVIHCAPWPSHATGVATAVYGALSLASRVSVPLFVVLSGMLLAYTHRQVGPRQGFWGRRLSRTLVPWLPWAAIYFALTVLFSGMSASPSQDWGWWTGGAGHLYFLVLIPQLYLLYMIWPKTTRGAGIAAGLAVAVQVGVQILRVALPIHGGAGQIFLLDYGFEEAPFWVGYFAIGILFGLHPGWLVRGGRWRLMALPLTGAALELVFLGLPSRIAAHWGPWVHGTGGFLRPSLLLLTALVFYDFWLLGSLKLLSRPSRLHHTVAGLSRHSLGIYIVHPSFLLAAGPLLEIAPWPISLQEPLPWSLIPFALLVVGALVFGWAATALLASRRTTAWAVGEAPRARPPGLRRGQGMRSFKTHLDLR